MSIPSLQQMCMEAICLESKGEDVKQNDKKRLPENLFNKLTEYQKNNYTEAQVFVKSLSGKTFTETVNLQKATWSDMHQLIPKKHLSSPNWKIMLIFNGTLQKGDTTLYEAGVGKESTIHFTASSGLQFEPDFQFEPEETGEEPRTEEPQNRMSWMGGVFSLVSDIAGYLWNLIAGCFSSEEV